jgi:mTERF domain-containing protein
MMSTARILSLRSLRPAFRPQSFRCLCSSHDLEEQERPFPYYVPIKKPPPEPVNANINRITDTTNLDPFTTDIDPDYLQTIAPELPIAYNMAAFVNRSHCLQELVKLGVDISQFDQDSEVASFMLQLNFDRHVKPYITALHQIGVPADRLGGIFTDNPYIFKVSLHNISARIEYLKSKKFTKQAIVKILTTYPSYLNYSIKEVDARLGFVQQEFELNGNGVRTVLTNHPQVLSQPTMSVRYCKLAISDLMGFDDIAVKVIVTKNPAILSANVKRMVNVFDYIHNIAKVPHEMIVKFPEVFTADVQTVRNRIDYLKLLGKDQFDPLEPLYIPLTAIAVMSDEEFANKFARTSEADYDLFLKNR